MTTEGTELTNFRSFREFRVQKKLTTDIRDYRDINHERKRKIPLICAICVQTKILCDLAALRLQKQENKQL